MTQFLTQLAARTLELTPTVQPRIASMFDANFGQTGLDSEIEVPVTETSRMSQMSHRSETRQPLSQPLVKVDRSSLAIAHAPRSVSPQISRRIAPQVTSSEVVVPNPAGSPTSHSLPVPPLQPLHSPIELSESLERHSSSLESPLEVRPAVNALESPPHFSSTIQPYTSPPEIAIPTPAANLNESNPQPQIMVQRSIDPNVQPATPLAPLAQLNPIISPPQPTSGERMEMQTIVERTAVEHRSVSHHSTSTEVVAVSRERNRERQFMQSATLKESQITPRPTETLLPPVVPALTRLTAYPQPREAPAAPTPTIHVTIGRIDVRAVTPPAPTRSRSAAQPIRMTLDDYLRSRNGGRS